MYLSKFTYYSFRVLICLANNRNKFFRVEDLSNELEIPSSHLRKVVWKLGKSGLILSTKGRYGGIILNIEPENINIYDIVKITEKNLSVFECFDKDEVCQYMISECKIKRIMNNAQNKFINEFSKYTLEDLI